MRAAAMQACERWGREQEGAAAAERARRLALERSLAGAQQRTRELEARGPSPSSHHLGLSTFNTEDLLRAQCT